MSLPVIAAAINRGIRIEATALGSPYLLIEMPDIGQNRTISLMDKFKQFNTRDYIMSGLKVAEANGCEFESGLKVKITGDLPINAGASSSSALVVAWLQLLFEYFGKNPLEKNNLANFAYQAEIIEHHEPGGFMDHYASAIGGLLYIENHQTVSYKKLDNAFDGLILANSRVSKKTIDVLTENKRKIFAAIEQIKNADPNYDLEKRAVSDIEADLKYIDPDLHNHYRAAIVNHRITCDARVLLESGETQYLQLAALMNEHHQILKSNLRLTIPKIDQMIDTALTNGADAAKINGSGLGGTIVILARENKERIIRLLNEIGADSHQVSVSRGAEIHYE
ncbi:MAG: hypothetical protein KDD94_11235 [Calditrichaeota bacterium]|nr:hypothetical protein [Calditrichota bacterium]